MSDRSIKQMKPVLQTHCLESCAGSGIKLRTLSAVLHIDIIHILHEVYGLDLADVLIQTSAKVICDIVLSIGKCTCTTKSAHDRAAITSHAAIDLCAVYRAFSSLKLMSSLKHCNLEIRSLLCQLICRKYPSWSRSNNYHIIPHTRTLQNHFIFFIKPYSRSASTHIFLHKNIVDHGNPCRSQLLSVAGRYTQPYYGLIHI